MASMMRVATRLPPMMLHGCSVLKNHAANDEHALASHDHAFAFSARLVSFSRPGRMALKKAF